MTEIYITTHREWGSRYRVATRKAPCVEMESSLHVKDDDVDMNKELDGAQEVLNVRSYRTVDGEDDVPVLALLAQKKTLSPQVVAPFFERDKKTSNVARDAKITNRRKSMDLVVDEPIPDITTGEFLFGMLS